MEVSFTPGITNNSTDSFWQHYDDEKSDSSCSKQDYFPTDDNTLLCVTCVHVPIMVNSSGSAGCPMFSLIYIWFI